MASYRRTARAAKSRSRAAPVLWIAAVGLGCSADAGPPLADPADPSAFPVLQAPDTGAVALADGAEGWRLRALPYAPDYFELVGWLDEHTLFGRSGCNPIELATDEPEYASWDVTACGGAEPAPDGERAAWGDGRGGVSIGGRGRDARVLRRAGAPAPTGEGDPTGLALWSPDGTRLLVSWAAEWESSFAVIDVATGATDPVATRADGYFLTRAWGWLDRDRVLFSTDASRSLTGVSEYREAGGYRGDLAVLDLRSGAYRTVTAVPDGAFLRPLAAWGPGSLLVGETRGADGALERYWIYQTDTWERRPLALPAARTVALADSNRVALLGVERDGESPLRLWESGRSTALAAVRVRQPRMVWSPDGRRLALAGSFDESLADGPPGSFVTRYAVYVIEPR